MPRLYDLVAFPALQDMISHQTAAEQQDAVPGLHTRPALRGKAIHGVVLVLPAEFEQFANTRRIAIAVALSSMKKIQRKNTPGKRSVRSAALLLNTRKRTKRSVADMESLTAASGQLLPVDSRNRIQLVRALNIARSLHLAAAVSVMKKPAVFNLLHVSFIKPVATDSWFSFAPSERQNSRLQCRAVDAIESGKQHEQLLNGPLAGVNDRSWCLAIPSITIAPPLRSATIRKMTVLSTVAEPALDSDCSPRCRLYHRCRFFGQPGCCARHVLPD